MSVFIILMFIFVLQTIWLYITELAGKALDLIVIGKFLLYFAPKMIPLVLPLTILLASIMVFGSFAENYEFAAMKSTGISLQRAMRSLSVFIIGLAVTTFFFTNNVIPWAEYKSYNLRKNIAKQKPAMLIAEGQFNEMGDYNIKVLELSGDRGQYLKNIVIHKKTPNRSGNHTIIIAKTGELISPDHSNLLQLVLFDGHYYDEIINKKSSQHLKKPHVKSAFDKYIINVDLEIMNKEDLESETSNNRYNMLKVGALNYTIDSLYKQKTTTLKAFSETLYDRSAVTELNLSMNPVKDSIYTGNFLDLFDTKTKVQIFNLALNTANSTNQILQSKTKTFGISNKTLNLHIVSLHEKFVLGIACIILFFVGAPLGALIRKGGIGLPMVVAILLFLTYHFIGIFAKNSSQDGSLNPALASWFSTLIMLPLSIYLTHRATKDRGLFELDNYLVPIKKLLKFKTKNEDTTEDTDYSHFSRLKEDKLIDIIKNHTAHNYGKNAKLAAFKALTERGASHDTLRTKGIDIGTNFSVSQSIFNDFKSYALTSFTTYSIGAVLIVLHFVFKNNKLPQFASSALDLGIIAFIFFTIYFVVSSLKIKKFNASLQPRETKINLFLLSIGFPFYPITYFILKNKLQEDLNKSCIDNIK